MDRSDYKHLFGPVPSRRFGRSLGIDLTPLKTCTLDCVFCQLGRTRKKTLERKPYIPTEIVIAEVDHWLKTDGNADYLTLSGSGEPTLHSEFGEVLKFLRHQKIPSVLLTNGTLLHQPAVQESAALARVVKVSLSAWDQKSFEWVNRPCRQLTFDVVFDGLKQFRRRFDGQLWVEVFLLLGINAGVEQAKKIARLARQLEPERIHFNTTARPPAEDFAAAVPVSQMEALAPFFDPPAQIIADTVVQGGKRRNATQETVLAMLKRRPCSNRQIQDAFGLHINEVSKILGQLMNQDLVFADWKNHEVFYRVR